jgi:immunity protein 5 of polymorphic toxin system
VPRLSKNILTGSGDKDMNITKEWLEENNACEEGTEWFLEQKESNLIKVLKALIKEDNFEWSNWTITKAMTYKQNVQYACYSAKQVLHLFEKLHSDDKRPREAIKAAMRWVKDPSEINRSAAESAARSAAESVARSAAESAARSAARSARYAAESAAWSARSAARSAARYAAESAAWKRILKYGIKLAKDN